MSDHSEREEYEGPEDWRRHKPYGGGVSRKRIKFVKSGSTQEQNDTRGTQSTTIDVASFYLGLVLKGGSKIVPETPTTTTGVCTDTKAIATCTGSSCTKPESDYPVCNICTLPIINPLTHQNSLAHQSSLPHSEPPHHLDRSSQGLKYLVSRGWDPDKKVGLGKEGAEGDRVPIAVKLRPKLDTVGLGVKVQNKSKMKGVSTGPSGGARGYKEGKGIRKLDAKSARKVADEEREKKRKLAEYFNKG